MLISLHPVALTPHTIEKLSTVTLNSPWPVARKWRSKPQVGVVGRSLRDNRLNLLLTAPGTNEWISQKAWGSLYLSTHLKDSSSTLDTVNSPLALTVTWNRTFPTTRSPSSATYVSTVTKLDTSPGPR